MPYELKRTTPAFVFLPGPEVPLDASTGPNGQTQTSACAPAVPSGVRKSTYDAAGYKDYAKGFAAITLDSIEKADPAKPTTQPVPYTGVQFIQIPEFQDLGTRVSQEFAAAIAGQQSTDDAIKKANDYANQVAKQGGYQK